VQHAGSDAYAQVPAITPFLDPYGGRQASSSAAVQSQPSFNLNNTEKIDSHDDSANANARPMSSGSSDGMSDNEWTGMLNLDGTPIPVRALMAEAIGDPYVHSSVKCVLVGDLHACRKVSTFPNELEVELAVGPKLSIRDIQVWIRENKAPLVRLSYMDGTDNRDFDQLVEKIRAHGVSLPSYLLPPLATSRF
jgi:hypothetical protein